MKPLFRIMTCALLLLCVNFAVLADCPRCHGKGRIKTFSAVSTYGVTNKKQQCPVCHQFVSVGETHYDSCPQCNGSGNDGSSSSGRSSSANDKLQNQAAELMSYLDPADAVALEGLLQSLFRGKLEMKYCEACNGTGKCHVCGGAQNLNMDATAADLCMACQGSGMCIACHGSGILGQEYVPWSGSEREQLISNIKLYFDEALKRQKEEKHLGEAAENAGNSDNGIFGGSDDNNGQGDAPKKGKSWMFLFVLAGIAIVAYWLGRRNRKNPKQ